MKAVVFDFDGPLFDGRKAAERALFSTVEHFRDRFAPADPGFFRLPLLRPRPLLSLVYAALALSGSELDEIEAFYRAELERAEASLRADDEIEQTLKALRRRGLEVAVVSSRRKMNVVERLKQIGLDPLVGLVHGRDSLEKPKPDAGALAQVAGELGVSKDELVFVGDSESDYLCAKGAEVVYYHTAWSGEPAHGAFQHAGAVFRTPTDLREALAVPPTPGAGSDGASLPADLEEALDHEDLCFYAGSGVSIPSGIGDWTDHYRRVFRELGAGYLVQEGMELPEVVQLLAAQRDLSQRVFERFKESFDQPERRPNRYHYAILRSQADRIWTSNYDDLFEKANTICGFGHRIITNDRALLENFRSRRLIVKMNGDFSEAVYSEDLDWNLVLTQEQFDLVENRRPEIWRLFEDDYRNRCIVFVGVSFRDPALHRILSVARQKIPRTRYTHYFLRKRQSDPVKARRDELHAANLRRQFIETRPFGDFDEIARFVAEVTIRSTRPIIGFSGSFGKGAEPGAGLPGGSLTAEAVEELGARLGEALARDGYRVTSGGSPTVGIPPVTAAFQVAPRGARFYLRDGGGTHYRGTAPAIVVPSSGAGYSAMRDRFLSELSLLIVLGGRPKAQGLKSGTEEEIELAMRRRIPMLIVPQAGGVAAARRDRYLEAVDRVYPDPGLAEGIRSLNQEVGRVAPEDLTEFARAALPDRIHDLMIRAVNSSVQFEAKVPRVRSW